MILKTLMAIPMPVSACGHKRKNTIMHLVLTWQQAELEGKDHQRQ